MRSQCIGQIKLSLQSEDGRKVRMESIYGTSRFFLKNIGPRDDDDAFIMRDARELTTFIRFMTDQAIKKDDTA